MTFARDLARIARTGIATVNTAQELRDLVFYSGTPPEIMLTLGAKAEGDGGGGMWRWDATSTKADNLGTCLLPAGSATAGRWLRLRPDNEVMAAWWGLTPGGVTDCSSAIQAAIDYAGSLALGGSAEPGVTVMIPQGLYRINTTLLIEHSGVSLSGPPGRGAELTGPGSILQIGKDDDWDKRPSSCGVFNLVLTCTALSSTTSAGITLRRTTSCDLYNVEFWNFYVGLDCYRASTTWLLGCRFRGQNRTAKALAFVRLQGLDESLQTGVTYSPGGGMHITDCEMSGMVSETLATQYGILVHSVDGLYITQTHIVSCEVGLSLQPEGSPANHTIATILCSNVYFDGPAGSKNQARCVEIMGSVSNNVVMADGTVRSSMYIDLVFTNTYFRAGGYAKRCVHVSVTDMDNWESSGNKLTPLMFTACEFRRCLETAFLVATASEIRPGVLIIDACFFEKFNESGISNAYAISARAQSLVLTDNAFANDAPGGNYVVLIADPTESAIVTSNDLTQTHILPGGQYVRLGITDLVNTVTLDANISPGPGRIATFVVKHTTTDGATADVPIYIVSDANGGIIDVTLVGNGPNGATVVSRFRGGYRREGTGDLVLSTGTSDFTASDVWNPMILATLPRVGKAASGSNTIRMYVTGRVGETWTWIARATFVEAT